MKQKFIPVEESFKQWKKDPKYVAAYDALEAEFALASAMIKARADADMTQEQVAKAMGTTQAVVARLESGKVLPSTRTLERFAKATRTRLRISFARESLSREAARFPPSCKRPDALAATAALTTDQPRGVIELLVVVKEFTLNRCPRNGWTDDDS
jgi:transcriptional regulator with XRE-family HTH domain